MAMQPLNRDEVLRIVRFRGPLIPNELKKALGQGDTTLIGAMLSELSSKGLVKVSKTKLGGSPFYYDPGQAEKLERIAQHLGEKDQRTWQRLKTAKVLRDDTQDALTRVSLRNIKDFAEQLTVNAPEGEVMFWKYFLITDNEAERLIKELLGMLPKEEIKPIEQPKRAEEEKEAPAPKRVEEAKQAEAPRAAVTERRQEAAAVTPPKSAPQKKEPEKKASPRQEAQQPLHPDLEPIDDEFYAQVKAYFDRHAITITEQTLIRKKSEIDFVIRLPTPVGEVDYYCKAKAKKRSNDGDLASAKLQGNARNLPALYLTTGEITKKAREMLAKEFKGLVVKEL